MTYTLNQCSPNTYHVEALETSVQKNAIGSTIKKKNLEENMKYVSKDFLLGSKTNEFLTYFHSIRYFFLSPKEHDYITAPTSVLGRQ